MPLGSSTTKMESAATATALPIETKLSVSPDDEPPPLDTERKTKVPPKKKHPLQHLIAGGAAGFVESSVCHPLDTIKTRMQLRRQSATLEAVRARSSLKEPGGLGSLREPALHRTQRATVVVAAKDAAEAAAASTATKGMKLHEPALRMSTASGVGVGGGASIAPPQPPPHGTVAAPLGPIGTANRIIRREGFFALYKGLTAVWSGIIPKMAIRFVSFEQYREILQGASDRAGMAPPPPGTPFTPLVTFFAGLASGLTEAIMVVTPAEVCKIRMQSQYHSMMDPSQMKHRKYTNVLQTAVTIVREEGVGALYKGVVPTMMRQGCNQAVNFSAYNIFKRRLLEYEGRDELKHWQSLILGGVSGGMGPLVNNPLDVVKTRMQKQVVKPGKTPKYTGLLQSCVVIAKEEGYPALWKGITPRLLRIMPGQAITFMTYEFVSAQLHSRGLFLPTQ